MKQDTVEKWILLEQSDELGAVRRWLLNRHLRGSAEARRFQDDLGRITVAARTSEEAPDVSRDALSAILRAARKNVSRSEELVLAPATRPPLFALRPALALAALVLIVGAIWLVSRKPEIVPVVARTTPPVPEAVQALPWDDGLDQTINELGNALASASEDGDYSGNGSSVNADLDDMATELMQWEGSQI